MLKTLRKNHEGKLSKGIPLENGATLRIELNHNSFEKLKETFGEKTNDNRIIAVAKNLHDDPKNEEVVLISNDGLVIAKADAIGIQVELYENDRVKSLDTVHKGYHEIHVPSELINEFYQRKKLAFEQILSYLMEAKGVSEEELSKMVFSRDFLIIKDINGSKKSAIAKLISMGNTFEVQPLFVNEKEDVWGIKPKNVQQRMLLELLLDPEIKLICCAGKAGTGKTLLALAAGLKQVEDQNLYKKMLAARPVVPMGRDLGFLPGELQEKLRPWMQPIYDNLEFLLNIEQEDGREKGKKEGKISKVEEAVQNLRLQIEALTYIRGRSIPGQYILLDESQNLTALEAKTLISRVGENSKIILLGDPEQIDHPYLDSTNNGLTYVMERMKQEPEVGIIRLEKTERSSLAEKAANLL
jgi:PhoH-like ATPase